MINPRELRIGNWVNIIKSLYPEEIGIQQLTATGIMYSEVKDDESDLICDPIPITTEILEKCGFYRIDSELAGENLWFHSPIHIYVLNNKFQHDGYDREIKSLHQLQNLHFALTGEELNYQP
jgi:hypothetical protein